MSAINENARLEVLRLLALLEDYGQGREHWPAWTPLFEGEWENSHEDIILAMQEATKLGHMENRALHASADVIDRTHANLRGGRDWMVRLTPTGYAWIKAHDALGEASQERVP